MIVVDASAVIAIMNEERDYENVTARLLASEERLIQPVSYVEAVMALSCQYAEPSLQLDVFLKRAAIRIHSIDGVQADFARQAFLTYGKGRHPARLNLGDCFSYAAAKALNAPLLYVGGDFAKTDIRAA